MNKLNGSTMTQIEKSNTCLNMASRISALFVEAENEVEFNKQDIIDILGTCISNITGEHGFLCLTGDTQARPEFNAYSGKIAIHTASPSNNTCLVIDEQGRSGLVPFFQIKSEPEPQTNINITPPKPSEEENKYLAKYLAKEKAAQGIHIQSDPKQEQHQEKLNLIHDAKGRAFISLINFYNLSSTYPSDGDYIKLCAAAVNNLFFGLSIDDKYLEHKLNALVEKAKGIELKYCNGRPYGSYQADRDDVVKKAQSIRGDVNLTFSFLN